jgi:nucleoid-associated protein YgaU
MEQLSDVGPSDLEPPSEQASDESEEPIQRNPPRDWAAPPPWATGAATAAALSGRPAGPGTPGQGGSPSEPPPPSRQVEGQGLAGSPADRLAAGEVPAAVAWSASAGGHAATAPDEELAGLVQPRSSSTSGSAPAGSSATGDQSVPAAALAAAAAAAAASAPAQSAPQPVVRSSDPYPPSTRTGKRPSVSSTRDVVTGPTWERIQRVDTYPTIKSGSSMRGVPRLALFVGALAIAALILFMLPAIIGIGGGGSSSSASPSGSHPAASRSAAPTVVAAPTPVVYVIKKGDTLSKVANKFGVELDTLLAANPAIKDPNKISLGQEIVIPTAAPPSIEATAKPSASTAPE